MEELRKIFIVRTSTVAKLCRGAYSATHRIRFAVGMGMLKGSVWDPKAAAEAVEWPDVLALSGILLSDIPAGLAELVEEATLLSPWEKAVKPACTRLPDI